MADEGGTPAWGPHLTGNSTDTDLSGRHPVLTLDGGMIAAHPGPVLVVAADGAVAAANPQGAEMVAAIADGRLGDLVEMAARGRELQRPVADLIGVPGTGGLKVYDWLALPAEGGQVVLLARDVTLERNLRTALFESRQRYKDLVEISSDFAWEVGADGSFVFVSPRGALGYPPESLVGRAAADFVVEQPGLDAPLPFHTPQAIDYAEIWMRRADGGLACLTVAAAPLIGPAGEWRGARGVCRDVTNERARDAALARASNRERLLTYIVRSIRDVVDPADMLLAAAEATGRAIGARGCQVLRTNGDGELGLTAEFGTCGDAGAALAALRDGEHFEEVGAARLIAAPARYRHGVNGALCLWRDLDQPAWSDDDRLLCDGVATQIGIAIEQIQNHERILLLSRTDALTGLFNRRAFMEELGRRFQRLSRENRYAALIYCDLDNFKLVNDAHGHQRGDEALIAVRDILVHNTRPIDLIARLGGDEFAVWLEGADEAIAIARCRSLIDAAGMLYGYSGHPEQPLHMSLGVAVHDPARPEALDELVARADKAMYRAKRDGKGDWALAPPAGRRDGAP